MGGHPVVCCLGGGLWRHPAYVQASGQDLIFQAPWLSGPGIQPRNRSQLPAGESEASLLETLPVGAHHRQPMPTTVTLDSGGNSWAGQSEGPGSVCVMIQLDACFHGGIPALLHSILSALLGLRAPAPLSLRIFPLFMCGGSPEDSGADLGRKV